MEFQTEALEYRQGGYGAPRAGICAGLLAASILFAQPASSQSFLCDRLSGMSAFSRDDCFRGRCQQRADEGVKWAEDQLMWPHYLLKIELTALRLQGVGKSDVAGASPPSHVYGIVARDSERVTALVAQVNGGTLVQFFFTSLTLHWVDSYYPRLQDRPPARLMAYASRCRPL